MPNDAFSYVRVYEIRVMSTETNTPGVTFYYHEFEPDKLLSIL